VAAPRHLRRSDRLGTRHTGKDLPRRGAFDASLAAIRAAAEAQAARKTGDHDRAARHEHVADSYRALRNR
jgi:hypothetical protein